MTTKRSASRYILPLLEVLPWIITCIINIHFVFTSPPPTAGAKLLWIVPLLISTSISLLFLVYHAYKLRLSYYPISDLDRALLDAFRSITCSIGLFVLDIYVAWFAIGGIISNTFGNLNAIDKDGMIAAGWIVGSFGIMVIVLFWAIFGGAICMVAVTDVKTILTLRKEKGSRDPEAGTEILEVEDRRYEARG